MTDAEWPAVNRRRCELIDREIAGTLTDAEAEELRRLNVAADEYIGTRPTAELERLEEIVRGFVSGEACPMCEEE